MRESWIWVKVCPRCRLWLLPGVLQSKCLSLPVDSMLALSIKLLHVINYMSSPSRSFDEVDLPTFEEPLLLPPRTGCSKAEPKARPYGS
ncbi:hypothetical protein EMPS_00001 [Entomortierella parvispora]|uniref:Uncharacterized protein n=1 Tax=Entomortierella parvispora TaxID=205924 RepID=A0A9P3GYL7_9FUNG|nr:hypothetical protein EMPS_00001 [Entomortierella parvispora]